MVSSRLAYPFRCACERYLHKIWYFGRNQNPRATQTTSQEEILTHLTGKVAFTMPDQFGNMTKTFHLTGSRPTSGSDAETIGTKTTCFTYVFIFRIYVSVRYVRSEICLERVEHITWNLWNGTNSFIGSVRFRTVPCHPRPRGTSLIQKHV